MLFHILLVARQTKALHEVQLLMNIYQLKYTTNN